MKIKNSIVCVQYRGKWKQVVDRAKIFNQEILRLEQKEEEPKQEGEVEEEKEEEEKKKEEKEKKKKTIAASFKAQSLSSFGHVQMMPDNRTVKKLFNGKPVKENTSSSVTGLLHRLFENSL